MSSAEPLHPIVDFAWGLLADRDEEPLLDVEALESIADRLRPLFGSPELKRAVIDLLRLACWLETEAGAVETANAIILMLDAQTTEPLRLLRIACGEGDDLGGRDFQRFHAGEGPKAPKVGEDAPGGSVKAGSFNFPKRG
jgi:hypothetical protein